MTDEPMSAVIGQGEAEQSRSPFGTFTPARKNRYTWPRAIVVAADGTETSIELVTDTTYVVRVVVTDGNATMQMMAHDSTTGEFVGGAPFDPMDHLPY